MKTLTKSALLALMLVFAVACSQEKKEVEENAAEVAVVTESPMTVLNANLASANELKDLGLADEMVSSNCRS